MENWSIIPGFPNYMVSDYGDVLNRKRNKLLTPSLVGDGYLSFHLCKNGIVYPRLAHRLVAETFITRNIIGLDVDHGDNNITNNYVGNLEVVTRSINIQRGYDRGSKIPSHMKPVRIVETGEEFRSVSDCARVLNRTQAAASYALKNGTSTAGVHLEEVIS